MQISVQIGLHWNWPTGTELGKSCNNIIFMIENRKHLILIQHTKQTKPNQTGPRITFAPILFLTCIVTLKNSPNLSLGIVILPRPN